MRGRDIMVSHVFQFWVPKVHELFITYTPFSATELPSEGNQYGRYFRTFPCTVRRVNIPLVTIHSKLYGQVINHQN